MSLLLAGGIAHVAVSLGWGTVLAMAVRRTSPPPLAFGAIAGAVLRARG